MTRDDIVFPKHKASSIIIHNPHRSNYQLDMIGEWATPEATYEERVLYAATLPSLLAAARKIAEEEGGA